MFLFLSKCYTFQKLCWCHLSNHAQGKISKYVHISCFYTPFYFFQWNNRKRFCVEKHFYKCYLFYFIGTCNDTKEEEILFLISWFKRGDNNVKLSKDILIRTLLGWQMCIIILSKINKIKTKIWFGASLLAKRVYWLKKLNISPYASFDVNKC